MDLMGLFLFFDFLLLSSLVIFHHHLQAKAKSSEPSSQRTSFQSADSEELVPVYLTRFVPRYQYVDVH